MFGMSTEQWRAGRPPLSAENEVVFLVWKFCRGWDPLLLPLAAEYYAVEDYVFLIDQLLVLHQRMDAHKAAQRA